MKRFSTKIIALALCALMLCAAIPFTAFAAPAYWGYDSYDTIINTGVSNITSYPTTLTKVSASKYSMSCTTDAGKLTVTLEEKSWGMFNLGSWTLVDTSGKTITFLSASTDWEYVYRTQKTAGSAVVWSGGNHGNEAFVSLDFYNGDSGDKIDLAVGGSVTANKIHIIEKSKLLVKADTDGDGYGYRYKSTDTYTDADVYANVTRKYTITGPQVKLNVDYDYVKDIYYQLSYTCMFPIDKKYGLYCDMYDQSGNLLNHITTLEVGAADYSGKQYSGNAATRAHIYGYTDTRYQFNVMVNTVADSLDNLKNGFKTSYWDMNTTSNKIYFSKYDTSSSTKVAAGTEFHTECAWQFLFDEDGDPTNNNNYAMDNLASGRDYTVSLTNEPVIAEGVSYAAKLTDGIASETFEYDNDSWFILSNGYNAVDGVSTITVGLDKIYNVNKVRLHLGNFSSVNAPASVKAYAKTDGAYTYIGDFDITATAGTSYWTSINIQNLNTDSIKLEIALDGPYAYINELEVHGGEAIDLSNIALRKGYTVTGLYPSADSATYPDENGVTMTDGVIPTDDAKYNDTAFIGLNSQSAEYKELGYATITVDLGKSYNMDRFIAYVGTSLNLSVGIKAPNEIKVYVSDDNSTWTEAGAVTPTDSTTVGVIAATVSLDKAVSGRYVQFRIVGNSSWIFVAEVEVYEEKVVAKGENLALDKDYTTTAPNRGDGNTFNDDQIRLTNGVKGTTDGGSAEYSGWNYTNPDGVDIIVDLGKSYYTDTYTAYFVGGNWGIGLASDNIWIEVFVSDTEDGDYVSVAKTSIGDAVLTNGSGAVDNTWSTYVITATADASVMGRYVKFHINNIGSNPSCTWIDEVEVMQLKEPATEPDPEPVIMGDVNFDGVVNSLDYLIVKRACFNTYFVTEDEKAVADLNADGSITSVDYVLVKRIAFDTYVAE